MSEPEFDVDAAEDQFNAARAAGDDPDADPGEGKPGEGDPGDDKDPPGFKSYEDYVADGGDPNQYVGKQAYEDRYQNIQENKRLRRDVKGLQSTVQQTMDAVSEWQGTERKKLKKEITAELKTAKEAEDIDGALDAQQRLDDLDDEPAPAAPKEEHSVIQDFRDDNPMIDPAADEYDEEFNADVEAFYNAIYQQLTYGGRKVATDGQIKRALKRALKETRELHEIDDPKPNKDDDDPGESRRNRRGQRTNRGSQRRTNQQRTNTPKAEEFVIDNPRNKRQANAAPEVRDMIIKTAYKAAIKAGKPEDDAKKAGDLAGQNFEESLAR